MTFIPGGDAQGNSRRICIARSADGVHWEPYPDHPVSGNSDGELDDVSCLHYDVGARPFVQNTRHGQTYSAVIPGAGSWRRIHLELRDAEVFSIRFADSDPAWSTP